MLALSAIAILAGCGSSDDTSGNTSGNSAGAAQKPASPPKPRVRFVAPKDGARTGSELQARVKLKHFHISAAAVGRAPRPGQGHLHFKLDGGKFDTPKYAGPNGRLAAKLGVVHRYSPALAPAITYRDLPPGKHHLEVYLANNNHTNVGVEAEVAFTVR